MLIGDWGENSLFADIFNLCVTATGIRGAKAVAGFMNRKIKWTMAADAAEEEEEDWQRDNSTDKDKENTD